MLLYFLGLLFLIVFLFYRLEKTLKKELQEQKYLLSKSQKSLQEFENSLKHHSCEQNFLFCKFLDDRITDFERKLTENREISDEIKITECKKNKNSNKDSML